jgi:hypothetical protein
VIPDLTDDGRLPPGIHQASLDELRQRFAVFSRSERRLRLFENFQRFFDEAQKCGFVRRVIVAGSFVTDKPEPNDFDCILVLDPGIVGRKLRPFEYNLVSRRMARRLFGGDILPALDGSKALQEYLEFLETTRDGEPVGVVEIRP